LNLLPRGGIKRQMANLFDGIQVFTATTAQRRTDLGEAATNWLRAHPDLVPFKVTVTQSSDNSHHCISLVLYYKFAT
jgi:hypothetical protein